MAHTYAEDAALRMTGAVALNAASAAVSFGRSVLDSAKSICALANGARVVLSSGALQRPALQAQAATFSSGQAASMVFQSAKGAAKTIRGSRRPAKAAQAPLGAIFVSSSAAPQSVDVLCCSSSSRRVVHRKAPTATPEHDWSLALGFQSSLL